MANLNFQDVTTNDGVAYIKVFWGAAHIGNIHQQPEAIGGEWYYKAHGAGKGPFRGYKTVQEVKISLMGNYDTRRTEREDQGTGANAAISE